MIYLAAPFSDKDAAIEKWRYEKVSLLAVGLFQRGKSVFSPLTYTYELAQRFGLLGTWDFWQRFDTDMLRRCDELWVYKLPGWETSLGVKGEIEFAEARGMPIRYVEADG